MSNRENSIGNHGHKSTGRRRGGQNNWRGGNNGQQRPRNRTESWPAVSNQHDRTSHPMNIQNSGRGNYQNWRGRGGANQMRNFESTTTTPVGHGFTSFSYAGPPPPIMQANFYYEAENWRPQFWQHTPRPNIVRPKIHRNQTEVIRLLEKQFESLNTKKSPEQIDDQKSIAIPNLMAKRELGLIDRSKLKRSVTEIRLRDGGKTVDNKATTVKKILEEYPGETLKHCQFMEATPDGKNIFGSWALRERDWSRIMCASVRTRGKNVDEGRYGIQLTPTDNYIYVMDKNMVDLCQAPVDNKVTCVLYITAPSQDPPGSRIFLQPVPELSETDDQSAFVTPIYNAHWALNEGALSCAWDFTRMRLSVGCERYGMIVDVFSEKDFKLFSSHKNVLAQKFSKDGSLLFMGVRDSSVLCCDLRRSFHHAVYALPQPSVCWLRLMSDANYLVAADFSGQIKLWDLRAQRILRSFDGQSNSQTKLPVVVDEQDNLVLAVGDNGTTSAWSLKSGELLRQIPCPYSLAENPTLPRMCYSGCWGGISGNAAIALGIGDEAHFYELQL